MKSGVVMVVQKTGRYISSSMLALHQPPFSTANPVMRTLQNDCMACRHAQFRLILCLKVIDHHQLSSLHWGVMKVIRGAKGIIRGLLNGGK